MSAPSKSESVKIGLVSVSDRASAGVYKDEGLPALEAWLHMAIVAPSITKENHGRPTRRASDAHSSGALVYDGLCP